MTTAPIRASQHSDLSWPSHTDSRALAPTAVTDPASPHARHPVTQYRASTLKPRTATLADLLAFKQTLRQCEPPPVGAPTTIELSDLDGLDGSVLSEAIRKHTGCRRSLGYEEARRTIFSEIDNHEGVVTDVYGGRRIRTLGVPKHADVNIEHVWPLSEGVGERARADLHNMLPADGLANLRRSSLPYGEVVNVLWQMGDSRLGTDCTGRMVFEPPDAIKGRVARILCYVAATYNQSVPVEQRATLCRWNRRFAVDPIERRRDRDIGAIQGWRNPFVEHPEFVDRLLTTQERGRR